MGNYLPLQAATLSPSEFEDGFPVNKTRNPRRWSDNVIGTIRAFWRGCEKNNPGFARCGELFHRISIANPSHLAGFYLGFSCDEPNQHRPWWGKPRPESGQR